MYLHGCHYSYYVTTFGWTECWLVKINVNGWIDGSQVCCYTDSNNRHATQQSKVRANVNVV